MAVPNTFASRTTTIPLADLDANFSYLVATPALGTPSSLTLTNAAGLPIATGLSGFGTGVATALAVSIGTSGAAVVNGGALGTPASGTVTNLTGTASININGTVGSATPGSGSFTSIVYTTTLTGGTGIMNIGSNQIYKDAAGNVGIGITPAVKLDVDGPIRAKGYTVATLPAGVQGMIAFVTNALTPTFLTTVVGGGTVITPVFYNGTNWVSV